VSTTWQNNLNNPGNWVRVQVSSPLNFFAPWMPASSMNLAATAQQIITQ
jgi:hypothetical protein